MTAAMPDWWTSGCVHVAPGVVRIPLAMPNDGLRAVNVYALEADDGLVLVDAGWHVPSALQELEDGLRSVGRTTAEIRDVVVTHIHRDHYTLAPELRRRHGTRVHLGRPEAPGLAAVRALGSNVPVSSLRELVRAGAARLVDPIRTMTASEPFEPADWEDPDHWLDPGPMAIAGRSVEVVPTPGHTRGHVVLHDGAAGLMFTGDHVLPSITPSIGFELGEWERPLGECLGSLCLLLERADAEMLPAHGHAGGSVHERVRVLLQHHEDRLAEVRDVVAAADRPVDGLAVARGLRWTRRHRELEDLDTFNQMIAVCEALAHLDLLVERGTVTVEPDAAGVARFSA